jgi:hypothetical protein
MSSTGIRNGVAVLHRLQRRTADDRDLVARELVLGQELADLHLDQIDQLRIVDHVHLVQIDDHRRHVHLLGKEDVLARLRHRAVVRRHDEDRAVHLGGAGDHVLDVVGVTRTVDVRVVARLGLVLDVPDVDRDPPRLLLRRVVDVLERHGSRLALGREDLRDRRRQRRLPVVDVSDRADVQVRLVPHKRFLRHRLNLLKTDYAVSIFLAYSLNGITSLASLQPAIGVEPTTSPLPRGCSTS